MPWCPNCKMEYDESETICKGCGLDLKKAIAEEVLENYIFETEAGTEDPVDITAPVEEDTIIQEEAFFDEDEDTIEDAIYSERNEPVTSKETSKETLEDISPVKEEMPAPEESSLDTNEVLDSDSLSSQMETPEYSDEPADLEESEASEKSSSEEDTLTEEEEKELVSSIKNPIKSNTYVKKEEQYHDLISSAYSFLFVSILGIAVFLLNIFGIIHLFNGSLVNVVMAGVFLAFLYVGITSYTKAQKVKKEIGEEEQVTEAINKWLSANITAEQLNSFVNPEDSAEIQFMQKIEKMKELVSSAFGELNELYLDRVIEEYYNNNLEH